MFRLRQREVVAELASWDPHLAAGIGKKPAAPRRARCCFIYLRAQVTFGEERHSETCLWGLPASPLFSSVARLPQKGRDQELSGRRFSISFNWSVNIHPLDSAVWLHCAARVVVIIYLFIYSRRSQVSTFKCKVGLGFWNAEMLMNYTKRHLHTVFVQHCSLYWVRCFSVKMELVHFF